MQYVFENKFSGFAFRFFTENIGTVNEEHGEYFHQNIAVIK